MLFPLSRVHALPRPVIPQSHNIVWVLVGVLANRCLQQAKKKERKKEEEKEAKCLLGALSE